MEGFDRFIFLSRHQKVEGWELVQARVSEHSAVMEYPACWKLVLVIPEQTVRLALHSVLVIPEQAVRLALHSTL